jgi:acetyl esterase/lipase
MQLNLPIWVIRNVLELASSAATFIGPKLVNSKNVEVISNLSYGPNRPLHPRVLDIYRPKNTDGHALPISILVHGGGFRFFSKDSHALCASSLAEAGQLVFCIDYGLTPVHAYPVGLSDVILAYQWIVENAQKYGGDVNRISLIGESAGSNLSLALCLHQANIRTLNTGAPSLADLPRPKFLVLGCGHLHVTDVERYKNDPRCFPIAFTRMKNIQGDYLPASLGTSNQDWGLANPLIEIERLVSNHAALPSGFPKVMIPVGEKDPIISDSERMSKAMEKLGQPGTLKIYPGQGHAFQVFPMKKAAVQCWKDIVQFIS